MLPRCVPNYNRAHIGATYCCALRASARTSARARGAARAPRCAAWRCARAAPGLWRGHAPHARAARRRRAWHARPPASGLKGQLCHFGCGPGPFWAWASYPGAHHFFDSFLAIGTIPHDASGEDGAFPVSHHEPTAGARFCPGGRRGVPVGPPWAGRRSNRLYIIYIYWTAARPTRGQGPARAWWSLEGEGGTPRIGSRR